MSEEIEIEYKSLLTKEDYRKLITHFALTDDSAFSQTNYYFDTPDGQLKTKGLGLRIRTFESSAELTLKSPLQNQEGLLETTDSLTLTQAKTLLDNECILIGGAVFDKIKQFEIDPERLGLIGELKTKRFEKKLDSQHLLVLDESWYHGQHDYELEMEVSDAVSGKDFFVKFLKEHTIPYVPTKNKISRTIAAKKAL